MMHSSLSQRGVALAIIVWFLAAMSLLVGGIVLQARLDVKLAQLHVTHARVAASADGAIQLALADLMQQESDGAYSSRSAYYGAFTVGSFNVAVRFTPLAGLIDLNKASQQLLFALFSSIEGLDENVAQELSLNVIEWRQPGVGLEGASVTTVDAGTGAVAAGEAGASEFRHDNFEAIEDLLLVPGIDRTIYDAVRDAVYVSEAGQAGVDWVSAPADVLRALGDIDQDFALELVQSRAEQPVEELLAPLELDMNFQEAKAVSSFRVDALVQSGESLFLRRRWVDRSSPGADGLPWRFFRSEAVTALSRSEVANMAMSEGLHAGK